MLTDFLHSKIVNILLSVLEHIKEKYFYKSVTRISKSIHMSNVGIQIFADR